MKIRFAKVEDLARITEIYNDAIINSTATFDMEKKTIKSRLEWFKDHDHKLAIFVAENEGNVMGWASLSLLFKKDAYSGTTEISLYVDKEYRGQGIGKALMKRIIEHANTNDQIHTIIARITGENKISIDLHQKFGFEFVGTLKEVGYKFERYVDVHLYQFLS
ncbi:GNAT family N-acetyltransferase [Orenia marismortui]|uniref:Phosphinothricin acetyltransferase n=1 Tax=Orenia marismortui TaxID=46469 RepID=A0A4R8H8N4_9FIRM|nr:GNAT family N-acetyltransferase [Orenia marismortui]TDX51630.1 phosphinothricin acetyltransferase [Orenia marismortui]